MPFFYVMNDLMKNNSRANTHLYNIDAAKGMAMLAIILVHFNNILQCPNMIISGLSAIGARCPQLFFIISAYLTWKSISKQRQEKFDYKSFWWKRFFRIAPVFYFFMLLSLFFHNCNLNSETFFSVVLHVLFLNSLFPQYINNIMGVEWYIADLALFYMLTPLLYKYIINLRRSIIAFCVASFVSLLFLVCANIFCGDLMIQETYYEMYFHTFCFVYQMPVMLIGVIIYYLLKVLEKEQKMIKPVMIGLFFLVSLIFMLFIVFNLNKVLLTSSFVFGLLFGYLFLIMMINGSGNIHWDNPVVHLFCSIGKHSLPIYFFHITVVNWTIMIIKSWCVSLSVVEWLGTYLIIANISYIGGCVFDYLYSKLQRAIS